jgi:hypothetical protein
MLTTAFAISIRMFKKPVGKAAVSEEVRRYIPSFA